jgi:hypothetical protein
MPSQPITLKGLAKSNQVDASVQAQNYLQKMIHISRIDENLFVVPDRICYIVWLWIS